MLEEFQCSFQVLLIYVSYKKNVRFFVLFFVFDYVVLNIQDCGFILIIKIKLVYLVVGKIFNLD